MLRGTEMPGPAKEDEKLLDIDLQDRLACKDRPVVCSAVANQGPCRPELEPAAWPTSSQNVVSIPPMMPSVWKFARWTASIRVPTSPRLQLRINSTSTPKFVFTADRAREFARRVRFSRTMTYPPISSVFWPRTSLVTIAAASLLCFRAHRAPPPPRPDLYSS